MANGSDLAMSALIGRVRSSTAFRQINANHATSRRCFSADNNHDDDSNDIDDDDDDEDDDAGNRINVRLMSQVAEKDFVGAFWSGHKSG